MEHTAGQRTPREQDSFAGPFLRRFTDGMLIYAIARPEQLYTLFRLSASAVLGILIGILCFFCTDHPALPSADPLGTAYITARAFSSYPSLPAYLAFFAAWFFHHAWQLLTPLVCVVTVIPVPLCHAAILIRGTVCGYALCTFTGGFSFFTVCLSLAQGALCALCIYIGTKSLCYVRRRQKQGTGHPTPSLPWLCSEAAPLTVAVLLALSALALGQLAISCICTLL